MEDNYSVRTTADSAAEGRLKESYVRSKKKKKKKNHLLTYLKEKIKK